VLLYSPVGVHFYASTWAFAIVVLTIHAIYRKPPWRRGVAMALVDIVLAAWTIMYKVSVNSGLYLHN
jgi:hypothetical protein